MILAWYKLDSDLQDYSGNEKHGTLIGTAPSYVQAKIGNGISCSSTGKGTFTLPIYPSNELNGGFSVSCFIKLNSLKAYNYIIGHNWWNVDGSNGFLFYTDATTLYARCSSGQTLDNSCSYNFTSYVGKMTHVAFTYDTSLFKLYVNGILVSTSAAYTNTWDNASSITVSNNSSYLDGILDDLKIFNHCLSQKEITNLNRACVAHYTFDNTLTDSSGYNPPAALHNTPTFTTDVAVGNRSLKVLGLTSNQYVELPASLELNSVTDSSFSISCYGKMLAAPASTANELWATFIGKPGWHSMLGFSDELKLLYNQTTSVPSGVIASSGIKSLNTWYHLVAVIDVVTLTVKLYVDGILVSTNTLPNSVLMEYNAVPYRIGLQLLTTPYTYKGDIEISDVRIYASPLTQSDITELYNTKASLDSKGNFYSMVEEVPPVGDMALWLDASQIKNVNDGAAVGTWKDGSGNNNNATCTGTYTLSGSNGRPSVMFTTAQSLTQTTNYPSPCTVFVVSRYTGTTSGRVLKGYANNWLLGFHSGGVDRFFFENTYYGTAAADTLLRCYSTIIPGTATSTSLYSDRTLIMSNYAGIAGPNGIAINSGINLEPSTCEVSEILIINRAIDVTEWSRLEDYFQRKYFQTSKLSVNKRAITSVTINELGPKSDYLQINMPLNGDYRNFGLLQDASVSLLGTAQYYPAFNSSSFKFNNTNPGLTATNSITITPAVSITDTTFTICGWFNPDVISTTERSSIFGRIGDSITIEPDGHLKYHVNLSSNWYTYYDPTILVVDTWYFVAMTWDGSNFKSYKNGSILNTSTYSSLTQSAWVSIKIGDAQWTNEAFQGKFKNFRYYNTSLSTAEIALIYDMQKSQVTGTPRLKVNNEMYVNSVKEIPNG